MPATDRTAPGLRSALAVSFRDPAGSLFSIDGRILRLVTPYGYPDATAFLNSKLARTWMDSGRIVPSHALDDHQMAEVLAIPEVKSLYQTGNGQMLVEHERVTFPSFPYEWPPEMLHAAGVLTLELAMELLGEGLGLKDGTPYNVLFRGTEPVFVDLLSVERRDPLDPIWLPYAQFIRTFLLPLLVNKYFGIGLDQILTTRRDGLEPEEVYRLLRPLQKFRSPFFSLVSMPKWLAAKQDPDRTDIYQKKRLNDPEKTRFVVNARLHDLRRKLDRLVPETGQHSAWSEYMVSNNNYTAEHQRAKQAFVQQAMQELTPKRVLDVGCNTGIFSAIAARTGAEVVAIDYDPVVLGQVWHSARAERLNILPLVVNLTRPSPALGWRYQECSSFLDRARGAFDAVLMLAVIHHMLVTERVPLDDILDMAAELTRDVLVIEFVAPEDSMFRRLTRGREELHRDLNVSVFETSAARHFEILRTQHLEGTTRWLYLLRKKRF